MLLMKNFESITGNKLDHCSPMWLQMDNLTATREKSEQQSAHPQPSDP